MERKRGKKDVKRWGGKGRGIKGWEEGGSGKRIEEAEGGERVGKGERGLDLCPGIAEFLLTPLVRLRKLLHHSVY